ncbi:hypothetical protein ABZ176_34075, partial [Streptomyces rochei]
LLVLGDASACRTLKAPGYLDERAAPFDAVCPDSRRRPLVYATDAAQARGPARRNSPDPLLTWEIAAPTA